MGAFLLAKKNNERFDAEGALRVFTKMGLPAPQHFMAGNWNLWSWRKIRSEENHFIQKGEDLLVCAGTPVYKGTGNLQQSLEAVMNDLQSNTFNYNSIRGSYSLIFVSGDKEPALYTEPAGIANVYFDTGEQVISNSLMALVFGLKEKLSLNRLAITEVLTCGRQIGPDTLFNNINRLEISLRDKIGDIKVNLDHDAMGFPVPVKSQGFDDAVEEQIQALESLFSDIRDFGNNYGVDTGLTAGHDSRMMLIMVKKYFNNFQIHSFWRKTKDLELTVAGKVAEKAGLSLRVVEGKHQLDKNNDQLEETLEKSLLFYDGHIRMHCFLMEDYHTIEHRSEILGDKMLGINGIGGEQYRNEWHMQMPRWSTDYFIRYALTYHLSGQCFTNSTFEEKYFSYLESKLLKKMGLPPGTTALPKKYIQKYYNEIYVASLMGVRTNAENMLGHFITPFIDRQLTRTSYKSLPHHGISFGFQQAMLRKMSPELAEVVSGYGYSFKEGEPFKKKIKYLVKELTPKKVYHEKLNRKFLKAGNKDFNMYMEKYHVFSEAVAFMRQLRLPIDEKVLTSRPDMMPVYLSMAYFLYYLSEKNRLETT